MDTLDRARSFIRRFGGHDVFPSRMATICSQRSGTLAGEHLGECRTLAAVATLPELRDRYERNRYVHLPQLISAELADTYFIKTEGLQSRRVNCGIDGVSWDEQSIPPDHELFRLFAGREMLGLVRALISVPPERAPHINCWVARYSAGEYINPHRDRAGTIQIILCLHASCHAGGGVLGLEQRQHSVVHFRLRPGDAIAFEAVTIEHFTTPPVPSAKCPHPMRAVAVSRYTFE